MTIVRKPIFIGMCMLAIFIYFANRLALPLPSWVYFYVNDMLCMPIVLCVSLAIVRLYKKTENLYVPISVAVSIAAYYAFHFEWLMPKLHGRYTADPIDVLIYFIGALLFFTFQKRLF